MSYIKGLLALQMLLVVLIHLAPGERYARYLRHFAELVLLIGLLTPVCEWIYGNDRFMEQIAYETFVESMEEFSKDMEKVEYGRSERIHEEYEQAMAEEVRGLAEKAAAEHGLRVSGTSVSLSAEYRMEEIRIVVTDEENGDITVGEVVLGEGESSGRGESGEDGRLALLREELAGFYGVEEKLIRLEYYGTQSP